MPFLPAFVVTFLVSTAITVVGAVANLAIGSMTKPKPGRQESPDRRQAFNSTDPIGAIPVVYGRARVTGYRNFTETALAWYGYLPYYEKESDMWINVESRADFLYTRIDLCEGEIEGIDDVLINEESYTNPKFGTAKKRDLYIEFTIPPTYTDPNYDLEYLASSNKTGIGSWADGLQLFRKDLDTGETIQLGINRSITGLSGDSVFLAQILQATTANIKSLRPFADSYDAETGVAVLKLPVVSTGNFQYIIKAAYYRTVTTFGTINFEPSLNTITKTTTVIQEIGDGTVEITDEDLTQSEDNNCTITSPGSYIDGDYVEWEARLGGADNLTPPDWFLNGTTTYPKDAVGYGVACLFIRLKKWTKGVFIEDTPIQAVPAISAIVQGKKIYDPRDSLIKYSNNPALIYRDYLTNKIYGAGFNENRIDDASISTEANYCEETVLGNPRYTCNGVVFTQSKIIDNIALILNTAGAYKTYLGGKYSLYCARVETPVMDFNETNIVGSIQLNKSGIREKQNSVSVKFINTKNWDFDIISIDNPEYLAVDKGTNLHTEITLDLVTDPQQAYNLGLQFLKQTRKTYSISFSAPLEAYILVPGDVITVTHPTYGYVAKPFRIFSTTMTAEGLIDLNAVEYDALVYDTQSFTLTPSDANSNFTSPFIVLPPSNIRHFNNNTYENETFTLTWAQSPSPSIDRYVVGYRFHGWGEYVNIGETQNTILEITTLDPDLYDIKIKAVNTLGYSSEWVYYRCEFLSSDYVPPDVQNFQLNPRLDDATLTWDLITKIQNTGAFVIKHVRETVDASWSTPGTFQFVVSGSTRSLVVPLLNGTYMIKALASNGRYSANPTLILSTGIENTDWRIVDTLAEHPDFVGTKDQLIVSDGYLQLAPRTPIDLGIASRTELLTDNEPLADLRTISNPTGVWVNVGNRIGSVTLVNDIPERALERDGYNSFRFANMTINDPAFQQTVTLPAPATNRTYRFSVWLRSENSLNTVGNGSAVLYCITNKVLFNIIGSIPTTWTYYVWNATFDATATGTNLTYRIDPVANGAGVPGAVILMYMPSIFDITGLDWQEAHNIDNMLDFDGNDDIVNIGSYDFNNDIDFGGTYVFKLSKDVFLYGIVGENNVDKWADFDAITNVDGDKEYESEFSLLYTSTEDDPVDPDAVWAEPQEVNENIVKARAVRFACTLGAPDNQQNIKCNYLRVNVYMKQIVYSESILNTSGGTITFPYEYYNLPVVIAQLNEAEDGVRVVISNLTTMGFDFDVLDAADLPVTRNISYISNGVGQKQ